MSSFEDRYYLTNPSLYQKFKRDLAFFLESCRYLILWLSKGYILRKALKKAEKEKGQLVLEEYLE